MGHNKRHVLETGQIWTIPMQKARYGNAILTKYGKTLRQAA